MNNRRYNQNLTKIHLNKEYIDILITNTNTNTNTLLFVK